METNPGWGKDPHASISSNSPLPEYFPIFQSRTIATRLAHILVPRSTQKSLPIVNALSWLASYNRPRSTNTWVVKDNPTSPCFRQPWDFFRRTTTNLVQTSELCRYRSFKISAASCLSYAYLTALNEVMWL
jgi:hypothetical protein